MSVQIFLSYARKDDALPPDLPDGKGKGFVACLRDQLLFEFSERGAPEPTIWHDTRRIERGEQFDSSIKEGLESSGLFLVVLSPNWMSRPFCRKELDLFKERWQHEGELSVRQRIVVACKSYVDRDKRPSLMQGQEGYDFFSLDGPEKTGQQYDFFKRGLIRDERYHTRIEELAGYLYRRAQQLDRKDERGRGALDEPEDAYKSTRNRAIRARPPADGRKVYLAKPASDMRAAYSRLVEELSRNGYAIVPDPQADIPHDASATRFIDEALNAADVSVHLLGEGEGYTPEHSAAAAKSDPIVKLQLARSENRVAAGNEQGNGSRSGFRRIVWAPEMMEIDADPSGPNGRQAEDGAEEVTITKKRLPDEVLAKFGNFRPTDKVLGESLSKFVNFLIEHLEESDSTAAEPAMLAEDAWVYVYHAAADVKYASELTKALRQRGIVANLPALEGDPAEVITLHQKYLAECSAVVLCWAKSSEVWARAHANELNWRKLGRSEKFAYRGLLAGPPPGDRKAIFVELPPPNEIDIIVDVTSEERSMAEAIEPFVHLARPHDR